MRVWLSRPSSPRAGSRCRTSRRRSGAATSRSRRAGSSRTAGSSRCAPWASSRPRWSSRDLVVPNDAGQMVRLRDVGQGRARPRRTTGARFRYNGTPAVAIGVDPPVQGEPDRRGRRDPRSASRHPARPAGGREAGAGVRPVDLRQAVDQGGPGDARVIAGGLVVLIIFLFLRNLRATIIPGSPSRPRSWRRSRSCTAFGFSINNFTLLALTLAIGIVVDDAIIVLENAYRHQEELKEAPGGGRYERHAGDRASRSSPLPSRWSRSSRRWHSSRAHGAALQRIRHRGRGLGDHLGLRGAHADADALRQDPPRASAAWTTLPGAGAGLRRAWRTGTARTLRAALAAPRGWW